MENVTAIVLAAGSSKRMGATNKLLVQWQGKSLVRHVVETAQDSNVTEVIVVTGHEHEAVRLVLTGLNVRFVHNPHFDDGMSTSLKSGIETVGDELAGVAVLLADMPRLKVDTLNHIIAEFLDAGSGSICVPMCGQRWGNPVIWPREFFPEMATISGDKGARELIKKFENRVLEVPCVDDGVLIDVDTPDDIE